MKKNAGLAVTAAAMLLTGCAGSSSVPESVAETAPVRAEKSLVILGDSISAGYGMEDPDTQRYGAVLTSMLNDADANTVWAEHNYALSGDDSSDLLYRLENGRAMRLPSADMIIICIGANNLLGAYTSYLEDLVGDRDFTEMTDEELNQLQAELTEQVENDQEIGEKLQKAMDEGLGRLETDLESIYSWIRERNADADIYVMNVYNPYADMKDTIPNSDIEMGDFSKDNMARLNAIIAAWEEAHPDLHAVDLATAFSGWEPAPIIGVTASEGSEASAFSFPDPHPNAEGQKKIAELLYNSITAE